MKRSKLFSELKQILAYGFPIWKLISAKMNMLPREFICAILQSIIDEIIAFNIKYGDEKLPIHLYYSKTVGDAFRTGTRLKL